MSKQQQQTASSNPTMRQCYNFLSAVNELRATGSFDFRCAIAYLAIEIKQKYEVYLEERQSSRVLTSFEKEMMLHEKECTREKDGKKELDVEAYMECYEKARLKYKKDFQKSEDLEKQSKDAFDNAVNIYTELIPYGMFVQTDNETKFSPITLSALLPFVKKKAA